MAIVAAEDHDRILGAIGLVRVDCFHQRGGIGYWIAAQDRGAGVATRAVELLSSWCLEVLGLIRLEITPYVENVASQRVAERVGYVREDVLRAYFKGKRGHEDVVMYARVAPRSAHLAVGGRGVTI